MFRNLLKTQKCDRQILKVEEAGTMARLFLLEIGCTY